MNLAVERRVGAMTGRERRALLRQHGWVWLRRTPLGQGAWTHPSRPGYYATTLASAVREVLADELGVSWCDAGDVGSGREFP